MHMRTKKWAKPELAVCPYYIDDPERLRGHWRERFGSGRPLYLELGCGKGVSTAAMAWDRRDVDLLALDITCNVLGDARRNLAKVYGETPVENALLARWDIAFIGRILAPEDRVERIYINFCNPWTKRPKYAKRRLTHPRQLMQYREFLVDGGEIWFKTDDTALFCDSLTYFAACGFETRYVTGDLHAAGFHPNYVSEHEAKFVSQGVPIKLAIVYKRPGKIEIDPVRFVMPGAFKRLRGEDGAQDTQDDE